MRKRFLTFLLAISLALQSIIPCLAETGAEGGNCRIGKMWVYTEEGGRRKVKAALYEDEHILAEAEVIASVAGAELTKAGQRYEFERDGYFVAVDGETGNVNIGIYIGELGEHPLYTSNTFRLEPIHRLDDRGESTLFFPLEQMLYLLNVQWFCRDSCVYAFVPDETLWNVLADTPELFSMQPNYGEIFGRRENGEIKGGYLYGSYAMFDEFELLRLAPGEKPADRARMEQALLTLSVPCQNIAGILMEDAEQEGEDYIGSLTDFASDVCDAGGFSVTAADELCQNFTAWSGVKIPSELGSVFDGLSASAGIITAMQTSVRYMKWTDKFVDQLELISRLYNASYPRDSEFMRGAADSLLSEQGNGVGNMIWESLASLAGSSVDIAAGAVSGELPSLAAGSSGIALAGAAVSRFYIACKAFVVFAKAAVPLMKSALENGEYISDAKRLCDLSIVLGSTYTNLLDQSVKTACTEEEFGMLRAYGELYASVNAHSYDALFSAAIDQIQWLYPEMTDQEAYDSGSGDYDVTAIKSSLVGNQTFVMRFQETEQYDPGLVLYGTFENLYSSVKGSYREKIPPEYVIFEELLRFATNMGTYKGKIYSTEGPIQAGDISIETLPVKSPAGTMICGFVFHRDRLYFCCREEESPDYSSMLYSCNPDGSDLKLLKEKCYSVHIENNRLYISSEYLDLSDGIWKVDDAPRFGEEFASSWDDETFHLCCLSGNDGIRYFPVEEQEDGTRKILYDQGYTLVPMENYDAYSTEIQTVADGKVFFTYRTDDIGTLYCYDMTKDALTALDQKTMSSDGDRYFPRPWRTGE